MSSPGITIGSLKLFIQALDKPYALPYWDVVHFYVRKPHIVHQGKDVFEEGLFVITRQAKKTRPRGAAVPPNVPNKMCNPSNFSFEFPAHFYRGEF